MNGLKSHFLCEQQDAPRDRILLSRKEKQKYYSLLPEPELFRELKSEYRFFQYRVKHTPCYIDLPAGRELLQEKIAF